MMIWASLILGLMALKMPPFIVNLSNGLVGEYMSKSRFKLAFLALTAGIVVSVISGCSTGASGEQVLGMPGSPFWFRSASMQTKVNYYKPGCLAYGFNDGTTEMSQCLMSAIQSGQSSASNRMNSSRSINCTTYGNRTTCR